MKPDEARYYYLGIAVLAVGAVLIVLAAVGAGYLLGWLPWAQFPTPL